MYSVMFGVLHVFSNVWSATCIRYCLECYMYLVMFGVLHVFGNVWSATCIR